MPDPTEDAIERLQMKLAYLEKANADLSDVVFRQQQELVVIGRRLQEIVERLDVAQGDEHPRTPEEELPPHY